jgi:hypothetical protein
VPASPKKSRAGAEVAARAFSLRRDVCGSPTQRGCHQLAAEVSNVELIDLAFAAGLIPKVARVPVKVFKRACSILNRRMEEPRVEEGAFINGELKPGLVRCRLPDITALNKVLRREDS